MLPKLNSKALSFSLKDKDNKTISLNDIRSDHIILYFYPKDNTAGCTIEANEFNRMLPDFHKLNTEIIGISGGDSKTKQKFCSKNNLDLILLSDSDFKVSRKYGVYGEKRFLGKTYLGIKRTTFILDKDRKIIMMYENVSPLGHGKHVLEYIKSLKK